MSEHVPEDLLAAFVDGDVDDQVAVHLAEHLDACPACATRAASLEPLAAAFASVEDPIPPPHLAERVLDEVHRPARLPTPEIAVGLLLLGSASLMVLAAGNPIGAMVRAGILLDAVARANAAVNVGVASSGLVLFAAALAGTAACLAAARVARLDRRLP